MESDIVLLNLKLPRSIRDDFKIAAKLRGGSMSTLIHQFMVRLIHEEKEKHPKRFPDYEQETETPDVTDQDKQYLEVLYESFGGEPIKAELLKAAINAVKMIQEAEETDVPVLPRRITKTGG